MIFILSKLLGFLINPLLWVCILLAWALLCNSPRLRRRLSWTSFIALFVFSNYFLSATILNAYEASYPKLKKYDVGIVLGGFSNINLRNNSIEFEGSGDRLFQAIKLYKKGIIKEILIASGNSNLLDNKVKEADLAANYLKEIGIPDSAILVEDNSRNTVENARNSAKIISKRYNNPKILVITSAWHIPRARLVFDRTFNKKLNYYPADFEGRTKFDLSDFVIPSAAALIAWPKLFKEWIGLVIDRFRI